MSLKGRLNEYEVPALLELARQGSAVNQLRILGDTETVVIYFEDGEVQHATLNDQNAGVTAIQAALLQQQGEFELVKGARPPAKRTIQIPWNALLLQALQALDEQAAQTIGTKKSDPKPTKEQKMAGKEKTEDVIKEMANDLEPGLRGIGVVGTDGLGIAFHKVSGETAESLGSQMALIMQLSVRSANRVESSDVEDVLVTTDKSYMVGRRLGKGEYFLVVAVERDSVLGNVRLVMKNYATRIIDSIPGAK